MPEGPEVRRMAIALGQFISGKTLEQIEVISGRYAKKPISGLGVYLKKLPDKVMATGVHGKFIYIILDSGCSIWSTLGMTGNWSDCLQRHSRVILRFSDSCLYFNDIRNFGTLKISLSRNSLVEKLQSLGPDMLAGQVTDEVFIGCLRKKKDWNMKKKKG